MSTLKFKTNINCGNCIKAVTPHLKAATGIRHWEVDTDNPEKILTVEGEELTAEQIMKVIKRAGFQAEPVS